MDNSSLDSLEKLHQLKQNGVISEEEFATAKADLLERGSSAQRRYSGEVRSSYDGEWPAENDYLGWMILPLRRYADFSGRSRRKEYWLYQLTVFAILIMAMIVGMLIGAIGGEDGSSVVAFFVLCVIAGLALLIPGLAVSVRRFHDQDKSGWFLLLNFIPYLGGIVVFIFMLLDGTPHANRFGDDPKGR